MKKELVIVFLLLATGQLWSQDCGTNYDEERLESLKEWYIEYNKGKNNHNRSPLIIPVTIWQGYTQVPRYDKQDLIDLVKSAEYFFEGEVVLNIYEDDVRNIENGNVALLKDGNLPELWSSGFLERHTLNILFCSTVTDADGRSQRAAHFSFSNTDLDFIGISKSGIEDWIVAHEIGHYLGLMHTFGPKTYDSGGSPVSLELVDGSNWQTTGDRIEGTAADPGNGKYNANCEYTCNKFWPFSPCFKDANGDQYEPLLPCSQGTCINVMSYISQNDVCNRAFHLDQLNVMKDYASDNLTFIEPNFACNKDIYETSSLGSMNNTFLHHFSFFNTPVILNASFTTELDKDVYRFVIPANTSIQINLSELKHPADLYLYKWAGSNTNEILESSLVSGLGNESITYETGNTIEHLVVLVNPKNDLVLDCQDKEYLLKISKGQNCQDQYEPNGSFQETYDIGNITNSTSSISLEAYISDASDIDYFETDVNLPGIYQFQLYNQPADYNLSVTATGGLTTLSQNLGTQSEIIEVNYTVADLGTKLINVYPRPGSFSCGEPYSLRVKYLGGTETCTDNVNEPNDEVGNSTELTINSSTISSTNANGYISSTSDKDIYHIYLSQGGDLEISLSNLAADYDFSVLNAQFQVIGSSSKPGFQSEYDQITVPQGGGNYFIEIVGWSGSYNCDQLYNLSFSWTPGDNTCLGDSYENNESIYQANTSAFQAVGGANDELVSILSTIHTTDDIDFYEINLTTSGILELSLNELPYNYDLYLYDGYGNLIENSSGLYLSNESISFQKTSNFQETIYITVTNAYNDHSCNQNYRLTTTWESGGVIWLPPVCTDNLYEPNESIVTPNTTAFQSFSSSRSETITAKISTIDDTDYYQIQLSGTGLLEVVLSDLPKNYGLELYNDSGQRIGYSNLYGLSTETVNIEKLSASTEIYYINVFALSGEFDCDANYSLRVSWTNIDDSICDDSYEPNNTLSSASIDFVQGTSNTYFNKVIFRQINSGVDADYYRLRAPGSGNYRINLSNYITDHDVQLLDQNGNLLDDGNRPGYDSYVYYTKTSPSVETFYLKVNSDGAPDCDDDYTLRVQWYPVNNGTNGNGSEFDPCDIVEQIYVPFNEETTYLSDDVFNGTRIIQNNYCEQGLIGNEKLYEFYFENCCGYPALSILLTSQGSQDLNFYLLDDCNPNSFCYGSGEENSILSGRYRRFDNLISDRYYYLLVDGFDDSNYFELTLDNYSIVTFFGCGSFGNYSYQCFGGSYDIILQTENISSIEADGYDLQNIGNGIYRINGVNSENVTVQFDGCTNIIPAYDCNVFVENCFGLNPPAIPASQLVCPGEDIEPFNIFNPDGYDVVWYIDEDGESPIHYGNNYTPSDYGIYYLKFEDYDLNCSSPLIGVEVRQDEELEIQPLVSDNLCNGNSDGNIELIFNRDIDLLDIEWSNGAENTHAISQLSAGEYTVSITTNNGCMYEEIYRVTEPDAIVLDKSSIPETDLHLCDGESIMLNPTFTGGTPPYSFQWSTGATTYNLLLEEEGAYKLEVIDAIGCFTTLDFVVSKSVFENIEFQYDYYDGGNYISLNSGYVEDGMWSTFENSPFIDVSSTGWYSYKFTDDFGCSVSDSVYVDYIEKLSTSIEINEEMCGMKDGRISILNNFGLPPYEYKIDSQEYQSESEFENLENGEYLITTKDNGGTVYTETVQINNIGEEVSYDIVFDTINTQISVEINSGAEPLTFIWNGEAGTQDFYEIIDNEPISLTVEGSDGCSLDTVLTVLIFTSVDEKKMNPIKVYPNPAQDFIFIEGISIETSTLHNINGELLKSIPLSSNTLDTSELLPGIYILKSSDTEIIKFIKI